MVAYWLARARIVDPVDYKKYADQVPEILAKYGAKVLARGGSRPWSRRWPATSRRNTSKPPAFAWAARGSTSW
jgi:uncharacterized protein (DUF1330 family)